MAISFSPKEKKHLWLDVTAYVIPLMFIFQFALARRLLR